MSRITRLWQREAAASRHGRLPHRVAAPFLAAFACLWAPAASAEVLLFGANINQTQTFDGTAGFVNLNGNLTGGTKLTFSTTTANQRVIITFNASCQVSLTADLFTYAQVAILVDPAGSVGEFSAPPTNTTLPAPFCTRGDGVGAAIVASARPSIAGTHSVRVRVTPRGPDPSAVTVLLRATSLTVMR